MTGFASHKVSIVTGSVLALAVLTGAVQAQSGAAVLAPVSGTAAIFGDSIVMAAHRELGDDVPVIDDGCATPTAARAARDVVEAGDSLVLGLPCIDAFDGAAPVLAAASVPVLAIGLQADDITQSPHDDEPWPVFRIGPRQNDEWSVLARFVASHWRNENFAIIDDGTLYGRRLAENLRLLLASSALEPVFVDTYRPLLADQTGLVRRLQRSGATHVILGGGAVDAAVIGTDAARIGYDLAIAGGSMLRAPLSDGQLPDGTIITAIPEDTDLGAIAAQIARQSLSEGPGGSPLARLRSIAFDTDLGPIRFDDRGEPDYQFFAIHEVQGGHAWQIDKPKR